jgi:hypothetical protein
MGLVGHTGLDSASIIGLVNLGGISFIGPFGLIGLAGLVRLGSFGLNGLSNILIRCEGHNSLFSLIGNISLVGFSLISFIGLIGLGDFGFSLISLIGLIGHISLNDLMASWKHWPISLIGIIVFGLIASSASAISSAHWLIGLVSLGLATALIAAKQYYYCGSSTQHHTESPRCVSALAKLST